VLSGEGCRTVMCGYRAKVELSLAGENCSTGVKTSYSVTSFAINII